MVTLQPLVKFSLFMLVACPITAIVIYNSKLWANICAKYDDADTDEK
jgi:hypothetical protein